MIDCGRSGENNNIATETEMDYDYERGSGPSRRNRGDRFGTQQQMNDGPSAYGYDNDHNQGGRGNGRAGRGRGGRGAGGRGGRHHKPYGYGQGDYDNNNTMNNNNEQEFNNNNNNGGALTFRQFAYKFLPNDASPEEAEEKYNQYKIENKELFYEQYFVRQMKDQWMLRTFDPRVLELNQQQRIELAKKESENFASEFQTTGVVKDLPDYNEYAEEEEEEK